jgi:hypothetical protein
MTTIDHASRPANWETEGSYSRGKYQCTWILSRKIASAGWLIPVVFRFSLLIIHGRHVMLSRRNDADEIFHGNESTLENIAPIHSARKSQCPWIKLNDDKIQCTQRSAKSIYLYKICCKETQCITSRYQSPRLPITREPPLLYPRPNQIMTWPRFLWPPRQLQPPQRPPATIPQES